MNGGFERARAVFGGEAELERILQHEPSRVRHRIPGALEAGGAIGPTNP